ncbi:uncharacterized protein MONBRDRAFT_33333 [Monosiga brevicollis MX1]|uniref:IQ motif and ubiquitin-like domain-containing protein n=1 Tax=Monosiga brevicollis TaxID=81824 RepID=A9V4S6_MONBE|nr:uncharacterized protein MONBRDRAFT_33333 [Monosiga brevicollis MX1]EDQ87422.1 predicted protein [Monosiga brevicollis MX1]|eukprot:XP_001747682.1 hypothetical protein [Monosiga brevicollis MX1]
MAAPEDGVVDAVIAVPLANEEPGEVERDFNAGPSASDAVSTIGAPEDSGDIEADVGAEAVDVEIDADGDAKAEPDEPTYDEQDADTEARAAQADEDAEAGTEAAAQPSGPRHMNVIVKGEDDVEKTYIVHLEGPTHRKPFLGGYRHRKTGVVFHNAATQTMRRARTPARDLYHRTTQTAILRSEPKFATQTSVHTSTQMSKVGHYVTRETDKVIQGAGYETAQDWHARRVKAVIVIQTFFRRWKAQTFVHQLREARDNYQRWVIEEAQRERDAEERAFEWDMFRRLNPRTAEDFDMLYSSLETWRREQEERIQTLPAEAQQKARMDLLTQQSKYLASIDQLKLIADEDNRARRIDRFLEAAATPRQWENPQYGLSVAMETADTKRAKEIRDLYRLLKMTELELDERLDALLQVKAVVEKYNTSLCAEILDLIQREADMIGRNMTSSVLTGLRQRLLNLFLQFAEDPQYNPEAARLLPVHQDKSFFRGNVARAAGTDVFLTTNRFDVPTTSTRGLGRSKEQERAYNRAIHREDNRLFRIMLDAARVAEQRRDGNATCVMLMTPRDVRYLVESIWGSKSALSEESDLRRLVLARWNKAKPLSPWNVVLLDQAEVAAHEKLDAVEQNYGPAFLARVQQKHLRAKQHFATLRAHLNQARKQDSTRAADLHGKLPNAVPA